MEKVERTNIADVLSTPAEKEVAVLMGRFQPPQKGHLKMYSEAGTSGLPVEIFVIRGEKSDPKKSPFPIELQEKMFAAVFEEVPPIFLAPTGFIGDFVHFLRARGMEPKVFYCGSDRVKTYQSQLDRYSQNWNLKAEVKEVQRSDEDVSATAVRQALTDGDRDRFAEMTSESALTLFDELKGYLG